MISCIELYSRFDKIYSDFESLFEDSKSYFSDSDIIGLNDYLSDLAMHWGYCWDKYHSNRSVTNGYNC